MDFNDHQIKCNPPAWIGMHGDLKCLALFVPLFPKALFHSGLKSIFLMEAQWDPAQHSLIIWFVQAGLTHTLFGNQS